MKVMVIGGAGYIGSHVVRELLDAGHAVVVFDNLSTGSRLNLFPEATFVQGDILEPGALPASLAEGCDAVVHLAAAKAAGESMLDPEKYSTQNICGTVNILNAATRSGVRVLVFSSSAATYGEPSYLPIDERHPTNPSNYYGFTKLEIERILGWYDRLRGLRFAALRYFNAAGYDVAGRVRGLERNPANLIPVIMEVAAGLRPELGIFGTDYDTPDGSGIRDYVHVNDLARAHVASLERLAAGAESFAVNLGSGTGISVLEILSEARKITGRPIPARVQGRRPGDPARLVASSALARTILDWEARHSDLRTLVETTWNAYRGHIAN